jgi:predicted dehydrogenase
MTIRIGLIGCGGIAEWHVKGYLRVAHDATITAVCDVVEENARKRSEEAGGARIFSDYREMLASGEVDAVDICLPHHLHKDAVVAAATAGKHIICEKPLCLTLEEAEAVQSAVSENDVTLFCAHNQLYLPAVRRARQILDEGILLQYPQTDRKKEESEALDLPVAQQRSVYQEKPSMSSDFVLGQVYEIRTTDSFYHNFDPATIGWRGQRSMIGGGELIDTGYHPSYLLLYLAGSKPIEVSAMVSKHRLHFMDGEDSAQVLVRFANGIVGNIVTSWAYEPTPNTEKFSIVAEKGNMYANGNDLYYKIHGSEPVVINFPHINSYIEEIVDFVARLRDGRKPIHSEVDGINVLKMILGAYQSEDEKRTVRLI